MSVCPHERRADLPCPYPDCHAGVTDAVRLVVPVVRRIGTMFVPPTIGRDTYSRVTHAQMGGPFHGARRYEWMKGE